MLVQGRGMRISVLSLLFLLSSSLQAGEGVIRLASEYTVQETADRLVSVIESKGARVFLRVDHAAGAKSVGRKLNNTELVVFGNPKLGSALMACSQDMGIDLPMKVLITQDDTGKTWLSYNDVAYLAKRHEVSGCDGPVNKANAVLQGITAKAIQ